MKNSLKVLMLVCCIAVLMACQQPKKSTVKSEQQRLSQLVPLMSGQFDSLKQSQEDDSYYYISLKMNPIWTTRTDGHWLYVEQAVGNMQDKPYRQRIYHVTALADGSYTSAVYELPDAKAVVGAFEQPELLAGVAVEDLKLRTGCAVILTQVGNNHYEGSTDEKNCLSQLRGASYATSKVVITAAGISSWDQGFDAKDQQVWGAVAGPYIFDRK